jgi:hypothetical protein
MTYTFANPQHTQVRCDDDGATFEVEPDQHPSNVHGFAAEKWHAAGCPLPKPYRPPVKALLMTVTVAAAGRLPMFDREHEGADVPTSGDDEVVRGAFGALIAAVLDHYPASPARQRAIETIIAAHDRVAKILTTAQPNGITDIWLSSRYH